jgi:hypothetical protein
MICKAKQFDFVPTTENTEYDQGADGLRKFAWSIFAPARQPC